MSKSGEEPSSQRGEMPGTSSDLSKVEEGLKNCKITNSEDEQAGSKEASVDHRTPQQQKNKAIPKYSNEVSRQLVYPDNLTDGKWLQPHPWERKRPDRLNSKMADTVEMSKVYTVSKEWQKGEHKVDLGKICSNLPKFASEMKGPTGREELEHLLNSRRFSKALMNETRGPHITEIVMKYSGDKPKDKPDIPTKVEKFVAYSLLGDDQPSEENYWYLDCEYMLKMYLPEDSLQWFDPESGKRITEINPVKKDFRWVFIPSFRRAKIALLDWPQDDIITQESTLRILVVRPSEFKEYVQCCGHKFPVIRLPQDEIGAGYPRLWIQKIALRLKLDFIWMIDDSVKCFYEYHPSEKPENSYRAERRRPFGRVFERIEKFVKDAKDVQQPIAAMSPKQFMGATPLKHPFVCAPPRTAVFLNIKAVKSKEVYYRPELQALEDMIFGYECEQNGLKVFIDNRVHLQDRKWTDTGARSPSVQQNLPIIKKRPSTA